MLPYTFAEGRRDRTKKGKGRDKKHLLASPFKYKVRSHPIKFGARLGSSRTSPAKVRQEWRLFPESQGYLSSEAPPSDPGFPGGSCNSNSFLHTHLTAMLMSVGRTETALKRDADFVEMGD